MPQCFEGNIKVNTCETEHNNFNRGRGCITKMDVEYLAIQLQTVETYILVPKAWPERAHSLLLTLAEQIITQFNYVSPIVQITNIPTRMICRVSDCGFYYVFNKVSKEEIIGAFVYNILVPDNNGPIQVEIISGNHLNHVPWSSKATRVIPYFQQCGRVLPDSIGPEFVYRRLLWRKQSQKKTICKVCGRVIDKTINQ